MITKPGLSDAILAELQQVWLQFTQIEQVKLYGSRAKGNFTARSDIKNPLLRDHIDRVGISLYQKKPGSAEPLSHN